MSPQDSLRLFAAPQVAKNQGSRAGKRGEGGVERPGSVEIPQSTPGRTLLPQQLGAGSEERRRGALAQTLADFVDALLSLAMGKGRCSQQQNQYRYTNHRGPSRDSNSVRPTPQQVLPSA